MNNLRSIIETIFVLYNVLKHLLITHSVTVHQNLLNYMYKHTFSWLIIYLFSKWSYEHWNSPKTGLYVNLF